jgi:hypothetical protein
MDEARKQDFRRLRALIASEDAKGDRGAISDADVVKALECLFQAIEENCGPARGSSGPVFRPFQRLDP